MFAESYPLASFHLFTGSRIFGKAVLSFLIGKSILEAFSSIPWLLLNTIVWYIALFSPNNYFMKFIDLPYIKLPTMVLKEFHRVYSVVHIVKTILTYHVGFYFPAFLFSFLIVSSFRIVIIPLEQFYRGVIISDNEFKSPGITTKLGFFSSMIYVMYCYSKAGFIPSMSKFLFWLSEGVVVNSLIFLCIVCQICDYFFGKDPVSVFLFFFSDIFFCHHLNIPNIHFAKSKTSSAPAKRNSRSDPQNEEKPPSKGSTPVQRRRRTSKG